MKLGYVHGTGDEFDAYFPHLPKNTDEMRQTSMYSNPIFPISEDNCMHAYSGCPGCAAIIGYGSIMQMEMSGMAICPYCEFRASSLGSVASASSSISNGYEYHYAIVEKAAEDYKEAKAKAAPINAKVKNFAENAFQKIKDLI